MALSNAERGRALKERRKKLGLKRVEVWIRPEHTQTMKECELQCRDAKLGLTSREKSVYNAALDDCILTNTEDLRYLKWKID